MCVAQVRLVVLSFVLAAVYGQQDPSFFNGNHQGPKSFPFHRVTYFGKSIHFVLHAPQFNESEKLDRKCKQTVRCQSIRRQPTSSTTVCQQPISDWQVQTGSCGSRTTALHPRSGRLLSALLQEETKVLILPLITALDVLNRRSIL